MAKGIPSALESPDQEDMVSPQRGQVDWMSGHPAGMWPRSNHLAPWQREEPLLFEGLQREDRQKPMHPRS